MKHIIFSATVCLAMTSATAAHAAEDSFALSMVTCQSSWLDWKQDPVKVEQFKTYLASQYRQDAGGASYVPSAASSILGLKVSQLYPQSIGMGLGFSVLVDANVEAVKSALVKHTGKPFQSCSKDEGLTTCQRELAPKKTLMLMAASTGKNAQTLMGCYYYYEK